MEHTLGVVKTVGIVANPFVLILVLMEHTLGVDARKADKATGELS